MADGFFLRFWQAGLAEYDAFNGLDWSWLSMDGAMTRAPLAGEKTGSSPVDRAKSGTKRSLLVEADGVPVGLAVAAANKNDFKMFTETLWSIPVDRPASTSAKPQHLCFDKGYDFEQVRWLAKAFGFVAHIRARGEEANEKQAGQKARRWPVERTHSCMNRFRSLLTRWAKKATNYEGLLHFVCGLISYRAAGLFGYAVSVAEARVLIKDYRRHYNEERPHGAWATARPRRRSPKPKLWTAKRQIPCPPLDPPTKTATRITNPNLSPVLDQSRGLDQC